LGNRALLAMMEKKLLCNHFLLPSSATSLRAGRATAITSPVSFGTTVKTA